MSQGPVLFDLSTVARRAKVDGPGGQLPHQMPVHELTGLRHPLALGRLLVDARVVGVEDLDLRQVEVLAQHGADARDLGVVGRPLAIQAVQHRAPGAGGQRRIPAHLRFGHLLERHHVHRKVERHTGQQVRQRVWHEHEVGAAPRLPRQVRFGLHEMQPCVRELRGEIRGREEEQLGKVHEHVGGRRKERLELIGEPRPSRPDLAHHGPRRGANRRQDAAALHGDQDLVELERVHVEQAPVHVVAEPTQGGRLGHEQRVAAELAQRREPRLEVLPPPVALRAVVVGTDAGDVERVVAQLANDERRRFDQIVDVLELAAPVRAGIEGAVHAARLFHAQHGLAGALIRLIRLAVAVPVHHASLVSGDFAGAPSNVST